MKTEIHEHKELEQAKTAIKASLSITGVIITSLSLFYDPTSEKYVTIVHYYH